MQKYPKIRSSPSSICNVGIQSVIDEITPILYEISCSQTQNQAILDEIRRSRPQIQLLELRGIEAGGAPDPKVVDVTTWFQTGDVTTALDLITGQVELAQSQVTELKQQQQRAQIGQWLTQFQQEIAQV